MLQDDATLYGKLLELRASSLKPTVWAWRGDIIVEDKSYPIKNIISIEKQSNYITNYSDVIMLEVHINQLTYKNVILPFKDNLLIKLTKEQENTTGNTVKIGKSFSQTYRAFLTDSSDPYVASNATGIDNPLTDDLGGFITTHIQLVDINIYEYRLMETSGVFKGVTVTDLVQGLMTIPLKSNDNKVINVDMVAGDNSRLYYQMVIPASQRVIGLPDKIQKKYGIYASGIGNYLLNGTWYIFPLLNHQRFDTTTKTLTIINIPQREMGANDNSYLKYGDSIVIFSSGDTVHSDNSEGVLNNVGRGFRYSIRSNIVDSFRDLDEEGGYIPVGRNHIAVNTELTKSGLENIKAVDGLLTDNPYTQMAAISAGMSCQNIITWEFANTELLYPGMPTKILYKFKGKVQALIGTLIMVNSSVSTRVKNPTDRRYVTQAKLTINCERAIIK